MTWNAINEWLLGKELVTIESSYFCTYSQFQYETRIYKDAEGRFYRLEFQDDRPKRDWFSVRARTVTHELYYPPIEVIKRVKIVEYFENK